MKVAANVVERVLVAAQAEMAEQRHDKRHSSDYEGLVAAFQRAADLRDRPLKIIALRGRKSRREQAVLVTNIERTDGGHSYMMCLVPYTPEQQLSAKNYRYSVDVLSEDDKVIGQKWYDSGIQPHYHQQWIRADRLREDGYRQAA